MICTRVFNMKEILPIIADSNFNKLGVIDDYKSLIWTTRYYEHGDFELCTGVNLLYCTFFEVGNYVIRNDDENVGIIEKVEIQITEEDEEILIASGRFLTQILARRIIATQTQVSGLVSNCIYRLINDAIINPTIAARKINNFTIGNYTGTDTMEAQYTGKNLYDVISGLCLQYGLGLKVTLNDNNQFVFNLYKGVDRSYNQSDNPYVVFSDKYENLLNTQYQKDASNIVTNVLAAGEGEGSERKMIWVTNGDPSGLNRYEFFDDSRNISSNNGEISESEYMQQLAEAGRENLTSYDSAFAGNVDFTNVDFKNEVNIGDIVTIDDSRLNSYFNVRIIEVIESIGEDGKYSLIPTFGEMIQVDYLIDDEDDYIVSDNNDYIILAKIIGG